MQYRLDGKMTGDVLCEVGRGNEDAIQLFYLLKNDILNTVFHLLNGSFRPHLTLADDGISRNFERLSIHKAIVIGIFNELLH